MKKLFFLSENNLDGVTLNPRIPSNYLTNHGYEDNTTPRICFAPSIQQGLAGLSCNVLNKKYYVHIISNNPKLYRPSLKEVPDSKITGEVWALEPVKLKKICRIKVVGTKKKQGKNYKYGNKKATLYDDWIYKVISTYRYKNHTITASSKKEAIHKIIGDTDELDDADLGINVDPKEYHEQKSKMRSLQQRLDSIKNDINKESDEYLKELESVAKKLNEQNRTEYCYDNDSDKWLHYKGNINEKVIMDAFKDGVEAAYYGPLIFSYIFKEDDDFETTYKKALSYFKKSKVYKTIKEILVNRGNKVKVYRGLLIEKGYDNVKYMKYNLLDRNSWTLSFKTAVVYADKPYLNKEGIVISMDCCIDDINIPLTVWLYGRWLCNENKELNLYKSLKVNDIKIVASSKDNFKYHFGGI